MATFDEKKFIDLDGLKAYHGKIKETLDKKVEYVTESSVSDSTPFVTYGAAALNGTIVKIDTPVVDITDPNVWDILDSYEGQYGIKYSTDNVNWTIIPGKYFARVAASDRVFVAVEPASVGHLPWRSFDGINWERLNFTLKGGDPIYLDYHDGYFYMAFSEYRYGVTIGRMKENIIAESGSGEPISINNLEILTTFGVDACPIVDPHSMYIKNGTIVITSRDGKIYSQTIDNLIAAGSYNSPFIECSIPSDLIPSDFSFGDDLFIYRVPHFFDNKFFITGALFKQVDDGGILYDVISPKEKAFVLESEDGITWTYNTGLTELAGVAATDVIKYNNEYYISSSLQSGKLYDPINPGIFKIKLGDTLDDIMAAGIEDLPWTVNEIWTTMTFANAGFIEINGGFVHTATCISSSSGIPASNIIGLEAKLDSSINLVTEPDILTLF